MELTLESLFKEGSSRANRGITLIKIALDQFQTIMDTLGQKKGDVMLQVIAKRLSELLNKNELLARIEETKFAIIVQHQTDYVYSEHLSELILESISKPIFLNGYEMYVTSNIGISKFQEKPDSFEQLMQNANTALALAKAKGKNRLTIYSLSMDIRSYKDFSMTNDIRKALDRNELHLFYQPIIDVYANQKMSVRKL